MTMTKNHRMDAEAEWFWDHPNSELDVDDHETVLPTIPECEHCGKPIESLGQTCEEGGGCVTSDVGSPIDPRRRNMEHIFGPRTVVMREIRPTCLEQRAPLS
ncbi:MAG: hypothetical protein QNM02_14085, partial [Acidimicrobiia bacterium]|nr:hypothetical protein [Acidimicrobiia bacterium]